MSVYLSKPLFEWLAAAPCRGKEKGEVCDEKSFCSRSLLLRRRLETKAGERAGNHLTAVFSSGEAEEVSRTLLGSRASSENLSSDVVSVARV